MEGDIPFHHNDGDDEETGRADEGGTVDPERGERHREAPEIDDHLDDLSNVHHGDGDDERERGATKKEDGAPTRAGHEVEKDHEEGGKKDVHGQIADVAVRSELRPEELGHLRKGAHRDQHHGGGTGDEREIPPPEHHPGRRIDEQQGRRPPEEAQLPVHEECVEVSQPADHRDQDVRAREGVRIDDAGGDVKVVEGRPREEPQPPDHAGMDPVLTGHHGRAPHIQ